VRTNIFGDLVEFEQYADGTVVFKLRDIVRALGLEWAGQYQKAKADPLERYNVFEERFPTDDGKTAMSVAIRSEHVQNLLDDIGINRCPPDVAKMVLRVRDNLRGKNLAEEALRHLA
jgi:P22_AR N-terminal domain.